MLDFLRGDYDVLVTTTIIESGLDIPNANTLIVERADLLGLSQLYQIRGRIGRSSRVAHAFLFHPDEAVLTEEAMARLSTLADYTELGSGFKIAMRDLEIRGAGNLLGDEQSGHIAAVGFEMYLSMLRRDGGDARRAASRAAEREPRVEVGVSAYVPSDFIAYEAAKVDLHRRIAGAAAAGGAGRAAGGAARSLRRVPEPVDNLIFLGEVRVVLQRGRGRFAGGAPAEAHRDRSAAPPGQPRGAAPAGPPLRVRACDGSVKSRRSARRGWRSVRSSSRFSMIYSASGPEWSKVRRDSASRPT